MKYTRYNMKKGHNTFFILIIFMIIAVICISLGSNKKFKKNNNFNNATEVNLKKISSKNAKKFYSIQCGVFLNKENADTLVNTLKPYGNAFIVKEDNKFKVILGIYNEKQANDIISILNKKEIQNHKTEYCIPKKSLCDVEIGEIISANLEIANKFTDKNVKAIKTDNLKKWSSSLKKVDDKEKNIEVLNKLQSYVKKLPAQLNKNDVVNTYNLIYNCINSFK